MNDDQIKSVQFSCQNWADTLHTVKQKTAEKLDELIQTNLPFNVLDLTISIKNDWGSNSNMDLWSIWWLHKTQMINEIMWLRLKIAKK